jgi:hypothetical protein
MHTDFPKDLIPQGDVSPNRITLLGVPPESDFPAPGSPAVGSIILDGKICFTECSKKNTSRQKKITRFCYIVAKNGSVMKSNKKAELAGDFTGNLAGELVAKNYAIVAEKC